MNYKSLNESILSVTNPQPELTQNEYIAMLESALESIAEELECDVDDLVEDMAQTPQRTRPKKPTPKEGDYVYSHYRNATISKEQAMKDSEGAPLHTNRWRNKISKLMKRRNK